jgi:hypothetical protein
VRESGHTRDDRFRGLQCCRTRIDRTKTKLYLGWQGLQCLSGNALTSSCAAVSMPPWWASQGFANDGAEVIDGGHQQENDDQDGTGFVILKHAHGQLDLLPQPSGAN